MVYFLGRDVEVFVTTESKVANSAVGVESNAAGVTTDANGTFPSMVSEAIVSGGLVSDVTGVDVSIGISDEVMQMLTEWALVLDYNMMVQLGKSVTDAQTLCL